MCVIVIVDYIWLAILEWWEPKEKIKLAPKFDLEKWRKVRHFSSSIYLLLCTDRHLKFEQICREQVGKLEKSGKLFRSLALASNVRDTD